MAQRHAGDTEVGATNALQPHHQQTVAGQHGGQHRRNPGDLEVGATDVLQRHPTPHLAIDHAPPVSATRLRFEAARPLWLRECLAEATGVFCYVYCGVSANACWVLSTAEQQQNFGNLLTVGLGFGFGIAFALITSATTSGGHFHPAMTLVFATFTGFPWKKVPRYIIAQILGAFIASLLVFCQYHQQLTAFKAEVLAAGLPVVSGTGPAGIFVSFPYPGQTKGYAFANEFFADFFIGLVIWAVLDPNNNFMSPVVAPWAIGLAFTVMVWGFAFNTIATNTARDLGARFAAACFYGPEVLTFDMNYVAISSLTNIPAVFLGVLFYDFVMKDSARLIEQGHAMHEDMHRVLTAQKAEQARNGSVSDNGNGKPSQYEHGGHGESALKRNVYHNEDAV